MGIAGLGTDIVEFARFEREGEVNQRLAKRILTEYEMQIFTQNHTPLRYLAKRFAAKEATVKALGTGMGNGVSWQHVEVRNNQFGAPLLHFSGEIARLCEARGITRSYISISDEQHYAVATVILEF